MATVSLTIPVMASNVTPIQSLKIQDAFYHLIKKTDQLVPDLIDQWVSEELKDLTEKSTPKSRSISKVTVGVKAVIRGNKEGKSTASEWELPIEHTIDLNQDRDRFLLSLKTGDELTLGVVQRMRARQQKYLESNPAREETEEYRLLRKYFIEDNLASGLKLVGKDGLDQTDEAKLKNMARQSRELIHAMLEHERTGKASKKCRGFVKEIVDYYTQEIKSTQYRVKNLEGLLKKTLCSLAQSFKNNLDIPCLKADSLVKVELKEMYFSVSLDDGSK